MSAVALSPRDSVLLLLARARQGDLHELNSTQIVKLLYFLDLDAAHTVEQPLTTIEWVWHKFGPFSSAIYSALNSLTTEGVLERETAPTHLDSTEHLYSLREAPDTIDNTEVIDAVDAILEKYGSYSAVELRDASYETEPMQRLRQDGNRGDPIDVFAGSAAERGAAHYLSATQPPAEFDVEYAIRLYAEAYR